MNVEPTQKSPVPGAHYIDFFRHIQISINLHKMRAESGSLSLETPHSLIFSTRTLSSFTANCRKLNEGEMETCNRKTKSNRVDLVRASFHLSLVATAKLKYQRSDADDLTT